MTTPQERWEAAGKYALEGIKVMLAINGGGAIALLTFIGHEASLRTGGMAVGIFFFGFGALLAATNFLLAYLTDLEYGNRELGGPKAQAASRRAKGWHAASYAAFIASAICFLIGLASASFTIVNR